MLKNLDSAHKRLNWLTRRGTFPKIERDNMKLLELATEYVSQHSAASQERDRLRQRLDQREAQIVRLQKKMSRLIMPSWIDMLIEEIAKELLPLFPGRYYEILGPFGITAEISIHFCKEGDKNDILSISFRPGKLENGEICRVDYSVNTRKFTPDSLGGMNGMNYPTIPLLPETEVKSLAEFVGKGS